MGFLLQHSVHEAAQRDPDHPAFRCGNDQLTYGELSTRVRRAAHLLVELGVRPGDRVGLYLPKAIELPLALYAILEAGAAYVPIDPGAPAERVTRVLADAGIEVLVSSRARARHCRQLLRAGARLRHVLGVDARESDERPEIFVPWSALAAMPSASPAVRRVADDLAYIMFTSGSTGVPKGLMHTHSSGLAYAQLSAREYDVGARDRLGNHSPLHFDMSTFEYLTAPWVGATTVMIPEDVLLFPRSVAELIERERLTYWYSVPLALIQLLERGGIEERDCSSLRWVLFGGEPFAPRHLNRLMELWPSTRFSNSYGPAEVNQCTAHHLPQGVPLDARQPVPLGDVWAGAEGLIVDEEDREVSDGEVGELLIRSATRMRGYWRRPDLNERAFFVHEPEPGLRQTFYRTGDLVRRGGDGLLHFLGRRDRQVKVRGYRVELDEVEAVACELDSVAEAAAVVVAAGGGDVVENSIGLVVLPSQAAAHEVIGATVLESTLREHLTARLPHYALPGPAAIRVVNTLPRTGSGKVDRRQVTEEW